MILCDFDNTLFGLEFQYLRKPDGRDVTAAVLRTVPVTGKLHCELNSIIAFNSVTRDSRDAFVKETARRAAIKKMLYGFPRTFRTAVWEAYNNR